MRPLVPADVDAVLAINNGAVPAVGPLDRPALEHLVGQSLVALGATGRDVTDDSGHGRGDDSDELVGFCLVLAPGADYPSVNYRWFSDRYDDFVYLDRVAVTPDAQGRGVGRALYSAVEAEVERLGGASWFTLEVNLRPRNDASLAFHERLGFVEVGQQETDYGALVSMQAKRLR